MKILIFSWRDPKHPLAGGAEQVVHEHSKGWIKAGHEVTLFSSRFNDSNKFEVLDGVKIIRKGYQYLGVQIAAFVYYMGNHENYDLVIDQFHGLPFFTPLYARKPKIALIQETARNVWFLNPLPFPVNWIVGVLGYFGEPFIFLIYRFTKFATGSQSAKADVSKFFIPLSNITVWPHGVIVNLHRKKTSKEKLPTIAYLGVLSKDKGIEDALKCFAYLRNKGNYQFWIIGKPETEKYGKYIVNLTKKFKMQKKVKYWGYVSQLKKFELLSRAHLLINSSSREGWGLVNIEANAVGTPVVSYRSAGLVDSVKDGVSGVVVKDNTPLKLAETVDEILNDNLFYKKLQNGAINWSKKFNWDLSVKISLKTLRNVRRKFPHP
ncbi:MAG: glycosyl transferase family protein [uncultured bacterium]|uniref:Glycosyl transferase group 1 n=3 Tax=Candidatus Daviesiibacteriota TaxID=1752718 RepID=A0A0G0EY18_9BACT|nr:MAG: glycosyl transferase family protein [uncultured bacterium]KKQ10362.1 MAG: Glycosyl transferase group 1 [Candidatus Daviesbacteria bacterium GW2011_GWB1_36_5]KKQ15519.1 MAG: Glycosyl transferase group 1 [Candidatus Daviesbacteria bacterium GW2011_GWA1_36_8]OGE17809.1 MAG: hypothetical protein A2858_03635 [Candidatus Daviesbacteria bacterium RIFCSPHIGHO2_01_FULL_36_37]